LIEIVNDNVIRDVCGKSNPVWTSWLQIGYTLMLQRGGVTDIWQ